jgi:hypothetical protein
VAEPYRNVFWIVVFGLLFAMAEYGLAIQSASPHLSRIEAEFSGEPDHASRESRTNARDSNEFLGYEE